MSKESLVNKYFDYIESYIKSFYKLYCTDNKIDYFFTLGFIYINFMELWIKYCIINYGLPCDGYTIKSLNIDKHDIIKILENKDTVYEFSSYGVDNEQLYGLIKQIKDLSADLGLKNLSYAFRYPTDKDNHLYLTRLTIAKKSDMLEKMHNSIVSALTIFDQYNNGHRNDLSLYIKNLELFIDEHQKDKL